MTQLEECIERLAGEDEAGRIYAAEDIGYANDAAGVGPLIARLPEEPSRAVRESIFAALLQIENDAVIEGALGLLDSDDSFLRNQAVDLLRAREDKAIPYLYRAFREGGRDRRKFVIDVLAGMSYPKAFEIYQLALHDPDPNVVITTVENLGSHRQGQFRQAIEDLIAKDAHPMLQCACLDALAQIGNPESLKVVSAHLGGAEALPPYLLPSYIKLAGAAGGPERVHEIAAFAGIESLQTAVLNALTALRNRFPDAALPPSLCGPLRRMAATRRPPLAYQAVRLLGALIQHPEVFDFLAECLKDSDKVIRIGAIQALREARTEETENVLRRSLVLETDDEVIQAWAGKGTD